MRFEILRPEDLAATAVARICAAKPMAFSSDFMAFNLRSSLLI
jgi:hypothetical protein